MNTRQLCAFVPFNIFLVWLCKTKARRGIVAGHRDVLFVSPESRSCGRVEKIGAIRKVSLWLKLSVCKVMTQWIFIIPSIVVVVVVVVSHNELQGKKLETWKRKKSIDFPSLVATKSPFQSSYVVLVERKTELGSRVKTDECNKLVEK